MATSSQRRSHTFQCIAHRDGIVVVGFDRLRHDVLGVLAEPTNGRVEIEIAFRVGQALTQHAGCIGDLGIFHMRPERVHVADQAGVLVNRRVSCFCW
jgi:hypothetical protein